MAKPIGTLGNVDSLIVGGRVFVDMENLLRFGAYISAGNNNATFRLAAATSGYQVPGGKTLTVGAVQAMTVNAVGGGNSGYRLLQSDNDVGFDSPTSFSNPIYEFDNQNSAYIFTDNRASEFPSSMEVPATKYFSVETATGGINFLCKAFGYEA